MSHVPSSTRRIVAIAAMTSAIGVGLTACGGADTDSATTSAASPSTSAPTSPPASASASGSASSTAAPGGAQPASGSAIQLNSLTLNLPDGWQQQTGDSSSANGFDPTSGTGRGQVLVYDQGALSDDTLDSEAKFELERRRDDGITATRVDNRTVNGVEGYVITGHSKTVPIFYEFGTVNSGRDVQVYIQYAAQTDTAQATIESVLASITWQ